ncbi:acylphosphatase, partial [Candidatus Bathyarchaeota archaeon]|nr:acylphosphatase [Candidatus Bathyarchaeota archaeon]
VVGWVRNLPSGRVEAVFEGEQANVEKLIKFTFKGPRNAKVTYTDVQMKPYSGKFNDFQILW